MRYIILEETRFCNLRINQLKNNRKPSGIVPLAIRDIAKSKPADCFRLSSTAFSTHPTTKNDILSYFPQTCLYYVSRTDIWWLTFIRCAYVKYVVVVRKIKKGLCSFLFVCVFIYFSPISPSKALARPFPPEGDCARRPIDVQTRCVPPLTVFLFHG